MNHEEGCCGPKVIEVQYTHENQCKTCQAMVLFDDQSTDPNSPAISVTDAPLHIIVSPGMPEDHVIGVERTILPEDESCPVIPWTPLPCDPLCCDSTGDQASLFNIENPSNASVRNIQNDIWLTEAGDYRLVYQQGTPGSVTVYAIKDCTEGGSMKGNCCPPKLEPCPPSDPVITIGPAGTEEEFIHCKDGLRRQAPLRATSNTVSENDPMIEITETVNPDGGTDYELEIVCPETSDPVILGDDKELLYCDPQTGKPTKGPVACPPETTEMTLVEDPQNPGEYVSDESVWTCPTTPVDPEQAIERKKIRVQTTCQCCDQVAVETFAIGGGVCLDMQDIAGDMVWQSRDGVFVEGTGTIGGGTGAIGPLTATFTNPFDCPAVLDIDISSFASFTAPNETTGDNSMLFVFSDTLAEVFPDFTGARAESMDKAYVAIGSPNVFSLETATPGDYLVLQSGATNIKFIVPALGSQTVYGQWWFILRNYTGPGTIQVIHGDMRFRATWHKGAIQI